MSRKSDRTAKPPKPPKVFTMTLRVAWAKAIQVDRRIPKDPPEGLSEDLQRVIVALGSRVEELESEWS